MPISLNPGVKSLHLRHNALHTVDASLHFYTALQILDLSHNQVLLTSRNDPYFALVKTVTLAGHED
jgi:hypothetical protein